MISLYDHIIALVVTGVTILLLFNVHQRSQRVTVERTMMYLTKNEMLEVASILERDLTNAGYETPPVEAAVLHHNTNADGVTDSLVFWGVGANGQRTRIAYGVAEQGSVTLEGRVFPLHQLRRYERRGSQFVRTSASAPSLTRFRIDLLDEGNNPAPPESARRFRVQYTAAVMPTFDSDTHMRGYRQLHWAITLSAVGAGTYVR